MEIVEIKDIDSPEAAPYARLTEAQLKRAGENGTFIAESINVIRAALKAGCSPISILTERKHIERISDELGESLTGVPVYTANPAILAELTGFSLSRGVLSAMRRNPPLSVEAAVRNASRIAVLEGIVDPTNIGAIFRSAAALGMDAILVGSNCCDPLHRRAARVSMGAVFQIPWAVLPCLEESRNRIDVERLKALGFKTAAAALTDDSVSVEDVRLKELPALALILGTEGKGLCPETISACDYTVKIPMAHGVDSLNVAAASAVLFWELAGKRRV